MLSIQYHIVKLGIQLELNTKLFKMRFIVIFALLAIIGGAVADSWKDTMDKILGMVSKGSQDVIHDIRGMSGDIDNMQQKADDAQKDDKAKNAGKDTSDKS